MRKQERRAWICLVLAMVLIAGVGVFGYRLAKDGGKWASFYGNTQIYTDGYINRGTITDRNGDVWTREDGWTVYRSGGRIDTGLDVLAWVERACALGAGEILLTSMDADGTKKGYDLTLTRAVADAVPVPVIASGGAGCKEDFRRALTEGGADAALAASLFHYRELGIRELKEYLRGENIPVRL